MDHWCYQNDYTEHMCVIKMTTGPSGVQWSIYSVRAYSSPKPP